MPDATTEADETLVAQLRLAHELAGILRRRRHERGALTIGSFEPEYAIDRGVVVSAVAARPETPSHALVEEFMLAANEAVAEYLLRKKGRTLYRVHEPPAVASTRELLEALEELHVPTPPFPAGEAVPAAQLAEAYGRLSRAVAETSAREGRGRLAWPNLLLRSLKQARYAPGNLGHFGLASPAYLHFTSPIRRYPDLVAHRSLLFHLGEGGAELGEAELAAAGEDCSVRERDFARLELDADDVALCFLLEGRLNDEGWEQAFSGEIIGLVGGGLFVQFGGVFDGFLSLAASAASASRRARTRRRSSARSPAAATAWATPWRSRSSASTAWPARSTWRRRSEGGPRAGRAHGAQQAARPPHTGSRPPRRRPAPR